MKKTVPELSRKMGDVRDMALMLCLLWPCHSKAEAGPGDLFSLSIQDLLQVKVLSVSKREQALFDSAASVYVITHQDIRSAGVTTLPEALRLDPRLQVALLDAAYLWKINRNLNVALRAENLGNKVHYEFGDVGSAIAFRRVTWVAFTDSQF